MATTEHAMKRHVLIVYPSYWSRLDLDLDISYTLRNEAYDESWLTRDIEISDEFEFTTLGLRGLLTKSWQKISTGCSKIGLKFHM